VNNIFKSQSGKIQKLTITPYKDVKFKTKAKVNLKPDGATAEFSVLANPEKYNLGFKVERNETGAIGESRKNVKYLRTGAQVIQLKFLLDGTGLLDSSPKNLKIVDTIRRTSVSNLTVEDQVFNLKEVAFNFNGETHQPHYLEIAWGSLLFKGVLIDLNIEYTLFSPDGMPLRAIATAKFEDTIADDLRVVEENKSSPDLSHVRTVKAGDTLSVMTERIYGDSKYYLEVAKANNLINFRTLIPGQEIFFPPIEKTS